MNIDSIKSNYSITASFALNALFYIKQFKSNNDNKFLKKIQDCLSKTRSNLNIFVPLNEEERGHHEEFNACLDIIDDSIKQKDISTASDMLELYIEKSYEIDGVKEDISFFKKNGIPNLSFHGTEMN